MLPHSRRINKHLFREVFSGGNTVRAAHVYAKHLPLSQNEDSRCSFVVARSVYPKAVDRNKLKRRMSQCVELIVSDLKEGAAVIFFATKKTKNATAQEVCDDIHYILQEINLL